MNNARPYDLVIFDWDGTVMDSTGRIVSCMQPVSYTHLTLPTTLVV